MRRPLPALLAAATLAAATGCSASHTGIQTGGSASCADLVRFHGKTYSGTAVKVSPVPGRRLGAALMPPCDDTGGQLPAEGGGPIRVAELPGVSPEVAFVPLGRNDVVYIRSDRQHLPPGVVRLTRAPACLAGDTPISLAGPWLGILGPDGQTEVDLVPPYTLSLLVLHSSSPRYLRAFLDVRVPASLGRAITRPQLKASLLHGGRISITATCRSGRYIATRRDGAAGIGHNYGAGVPDRPARILLVSGSTRSGSTNTALLRAAVAASPPGVEASLFEGMTSLPHFNPDDDVDPLPPAVTDLRARIAAADAVLFCTPEYAGALPGSFKNLLDWTVGGPEMYEKPVAWVNAAGLPTRAAKAHESLATVLRTIHADIVAEACTHIASRGAVRPDGRVDDPEIRRRIAEVLDALRRHVA